MKDERVGGGSSLGLKDLFHGLGVEAMSAQPVDRFRRKGHQITTPQDPASLTDGCIGDREDAGFHSGRLRGKPLSEKRGEFSST